MIVVMELLYNTETKMFYTLDFDGKTYYRLNRLMRLKNLFKFLNKKKK